MALIVYPDTGYVTFLDTDDADIYFTTRLNSEAWADATAPIAEAALVTAFRAISELDITIDPTVAAELQALADAQCEQALHELTRGDPADFGFLGWGGLQITPKQQSRYSERALAILRPYLSTPALTITR